MKLLDDRQRAAVLSAIDRLDTEDFEEEREAIGALLGCYDGLVAQQRPRAIDLVTDLESLLAPDEPDPAQAPSNLGVGPVPLFLDGEEDEEDLDLEAMNRGRVAVGMAPLTTEQLEQKRRGGP